MIYIKGFSNDILELEENLNFFKKNGIDIKLNNDEKTNNVTIILKPDVIKRKIKRGGRYTKNTIQKYKIDEVLKIRETSSDKEIYEKLGLSKATYYRRLKQAQKLIADLGEDAAKDFYF